MEFLRSILLCYLLMALQEILLFGTGILVIPFPEQAMFLLRRIHLIVIRSRAPIASRWQFQILQEFVLIRLLNASGLKSHLHFTCPTHSLPIQILLMSYSMEKEKE